MAGDVAGRLLRRLVGVVLRRVAAVEDGAVDEESEGGTDEERHDRSDREEANGVHGRSGLSKVLLGSVAQAIVAGAKRPILLVRPPAA